MSQLTSAVIAGVWMAEAGALPDHAVGTDLLVVGSRGHGALERAFVGSVATQLSHHVTCPTVVIPVASRDRR
jgi:nucleotide-binding universal stress UspA family protein